MLWSEKYAPKGLSTFADNRQAVEELKRWAMDWERGRNGAPLLIWGPTGSGKTALVRALASEMGWDIIEMNASDLRTKDNMERILGNAGTTSSLFGGKRLIVIEEVDGISGSSDRGGHSAVRRILKSSKQPVILTATDYWNPKISYLRNECKGIQLKRLQAKTISSILRRILASEGISDRDGAVDEIATRCDGDLRSAINDIQAISEGKKEISKDDLSILTPRDRETSIWNSIRALFKTMDFQESLSIMRNSDVDPEMFIRWVEENIPREYEKSEDLSKAFDSLSRADVFMGRIRRRQQWGFLRYASVLASAGVSLSKREPYRKFVKYLFPSIILKMSRTKARRARLRRIGEKIGRRCHVSWKDAIKLYLPLIRILLSKGALREVCSYFDFDASDLAYLMNKSEREASRLLA